MLIFYIRIAFIGIAYHSIALITGKLPTEIIAEIKSTFVVIINGKHGK